MDITIFDLRNFTKRYFKPAKIVHSWANGEDTICRTSVVESASVLDIVQLDEKLHASSNTDGMEQPNHPVWYKMRLWVRTNFNPNQAHRIHIITDGHLFYHLNENDTVIEFVVHGLQRGKVFDQDIIRAAINHYLKEKKDCPTKT